MTRRAPTCPACGSPDREDFHEQRRVPVNSCLLVPDEALAVGFPRGDIRLALCAACGFVWNTDFDPAASRYSEEYEETQGFSPRFNEFARELAERWVSAYDIRRKHVLEIGCGKGEFLALLCRIGGSTGVGIDPSFRDDHLGGEPAAGLSFIRDFYSERYSGLSADVVVCRHTLEHIQPVGEFVRLVRRSIGDATDTVVLFELPDVLRVLEEVAFWDVYYEHCSYFTAQSLARLFEACGFDVLDVWHGFDGQYLLLEAKPAPVGARRPTAPGPDDERLRRAVTHFRDNYGPAIGAWRERLAAMVRAGRRTVVWGGGSKGVAFLTTLATGGEVAAAVDVNPLKQGKYMAGSGHRVVAPSDLKTLLPDAVVVMNGIYEEEIRAQLADLDLDCEVIVL